MAVRQGEHAIRVDTVLVYYSVSLECCDGSVTSRGLPEPSGQALRWPRGAHATVEVDVQVLERLDEYVAEFADFGLITRRYWAGVYLQGLFLDGASASSAKRFALRNG